MGGRAMVNSATGLLAPFKLGQFELSNRMVMAPLTRNRAGEGNAPRELNVEYYAQRAGAGLIISEGSQISEQAVGYPATCGIHSSAQVAGWQKVTDAVHAKGGHIFIQLWHVGRVSHSSMQPGNALPVAPSAIPAVGMAMTYEGPKEFEVPRALDSAELAGIVADYKRAAKNAREAGFDGVEVHAANGYLLDQFLRDGSNQREDIYGGDIHNRMRLLKEVVEAVIEVCGADRVGVRISPENSFNGMSDSDPQATFNAVAKMLSGYSLAYLHVLEGDMATGKAVLDYSQLRRAFHGVYMANNGYDLKRASEAITNDRADLISFGRLFLANPDLPLRFATGAPLNEPNQATFYGGGAEGYTDYPFAGE